MRRRETPERFRLPRREDLPGLLLYLAAGALYIGIGLLETDFLLSWYVGIGYLLLVVWIVPLVVARVRTAKAFAARTPTKRGPGA